MGSGWPRSPKNGSSNSMYILPQSLPLFSPARGPGLEDWFPIKVLFAGKTWLKSSLKITTRNRRTVEVL